MTNTFHLLAPLVIIKQKGSFCIAALIILLLNFNNGFSQKLAIGQWRDHLPYHRGRVITESPEKIFCSTPYAVFSFNKADKTIERISKAGGLSDVGVSTIKYHPKTGNLIIAYNNGNIDLYNDGTITNISDIKRSLITAGKNINRITFVNNLAYLSCGYGISILDESKEEIKESYIIGTDGTYLNVNDIASDGTKLFAATSDGVYVASLSNPNLANYNSWIKATTLPPGNYSQAEFFLGKTYVNFNSTSYESDSVYEYSSGTWSRKSQIVSVDVLNMNVASGKIAITTNWLVLVFDATWNLIEKIDTYQTPRNIEPRDAIYGENNFIWIADNVQGLIKHSGSQINDQIIPNSAASTFSYQMDLKDGKLWVANGKRAKSNGNNWYLFDGMMHFENEKWSAINRETTPGGDTIYDVIAAAIDPSDSKRAFLGAIGQGVWETYEGKITNHFNEKNSSLRQFPSSGWYHLGVSGLDFDAQNNLWVVNTRVENGLSVKTPAGEWKSFAIPSLANQQYIGNIIVNQSGQKWIELPNKGIVVFDDNGTLFNASDDKSVLLGSGEGSGGLHNLAIRCLAEDNSGRIWVGTEEGISVINSPGNVFSGGGFDAQRILVTQGGYTGYLLETETVTAIAVDGADRKWVATDGAGVFLLSPDGTEQLLHFTQENSSLLSNFISCIAINNKSGEIFFGTEDGICSYKSDATGGLEEFNDVYAYPNPVQSGYTGPVAIKNLVTGAIVKITDVSGSLVYETTALGGQAIWYGKDSKGKRVKSGVYLAFCSNNDGTKNIVTKILFMQ